MKHDVNAFNKWDTSRKYLSGYIISKANDIKNGKEVEIDDQLVEAILLSLENKTFDNGFIALSIALPSSKEIFTELDLVDPMSIYHAKKTIIKQIGKRLQKQFVARYNTLNADLTGKPYSPDFNDMMARKLKNTLLGYICEGDEKVGKNLAEQQLKQADNLTDRISALSMLLDVKDEAYHKYMAEIFYKNWESEELVILKWIALQAANQLDNALTEVKSLVNSNKFDIKVPNMNYALIGGVFGNIKLFHNEDGSGYDFVIDHLLKVDKINSSVASRLAKNFSIWSKLEEPRKGMIKKRLENLLNQDISESLREVVTTLLK
jgi:aminopeptidase N